MIYLEYFDIIIVVAECKCVRARAADDVLYPAVLSSEVRKSDLVEMYARERYRSDVLGNELLGIIRTELLCAVESAANHFIYGFVLFPAHKVVCKVVVVNLLA